MRSRERKIFWGSLAIVAAGGLAGEALLEHLVRARCQAGGSGSPRSLAAAGVFAGLALAMAQAFLAWKLAGSVLRGWREGLLPQLAAAGVSAESALAFPARGLLRGWACGTLLLLGPACAGWGGGASPGWAPGLWACVPLLGVAMALSSWTAAWLAVAEEESALVFFGRWLGWSLPAALPLVLLCPLMASLGAGAWVPGASAWGRAGRLAACAALGSLVLGRSLRLAGLALERVREWEAEIGERGQPFSSGGASGAALPRRSPRRRPGKGRGLWRLLLGRKRRWRPPVVVSARRPGARRR